MAVPVWTLLALALLVAGVLGSVTPMVPAGVLSTAGVLVYWWSTGYTDPSSPLLIGFVFFGLLVVAVDYLAGVVAAKAGGASTTSSVVGAVVGFALFFVLGPVGILLGVTGTVLALELCRGRSREESLRAAGFAMVGTLGSSLVQLLVTTSMLVAFLLVVAL